jgi:hypothetical protein
MRRPPMGERLFKVLNEDGSCFHGGQGKWSLPQDGHPGDWMPLIEGELVPCQHGYHLCRGDDLLEWLGPVIYEAEYRGDRVDADDKIVVREARLLRRLETWTDRTARLFTCDCVERVLYIYEGVFPGDERPRVAIETSRRYAEGEATEGELAAAWAAANGAARDAWAAEAAIWTTAEAAARSAAWAAWDAARPAAWDAWDVRPAAWDVRSAARTAASAAGAAAGDAAREEQTRILFQYLYEEAADG